MTSATPDTSQARYAADKIIREYGLTDPNQISVEDIAWDRGIEVRVGPLEGAEAWLLRRGNHGIIRISSRVTIRGRQRFSIGHELGHWELHSNLSQDWICSSDTIHAYRGSAAEVEANVFAAALLMPERMLRPRLALGSIGFDFFRKIADEFDTTLTATALRIVDETNEDCYIVLSKNGRIRWWKRNERRSGMYLERGQSISQESLAWRCEFEQAEHCGFSKVPAAAWFRNARYVDGYEVWEESLLSREYGTVLTIICVV